MTILRPTIIGTHLLTWYPSDKLFSAEDSDLPRPSRVYDDACDLGYTVVSARTGRAVVVVFESVTRDAQGDVLYWDARPVVRSERELFTLRIFND
jgi:hypothetical protein